MRDSKALTSGTLEVEDEEAREARIGGLLERLNAEMNRAGPTVNNSAGLGGPLFDFGDRTTFAVEPPTELLSRIQAFLPQLQASNAELQQRAQLDPSSVDIENLDPDRQEYIQMNLGLGIFEDRSQRNAHAQSDSESDESDVSMTSSDSSGSEETSDDSDSSDSDESDIITSTVFQRVIKPLPKRRARPGIVVVGGSEVPPTADESPSTQPVGAPAKAV